MTPRTTHKSHGRRVLRGMPRHTLPTLGTTALVVALGMAACQGTAPPASLNAGDITSLQRADRIIQTKVTPVENALLINAHGALVEACMQQLGWEFEVPTVAADMASAGPGFLSQLEQWTFADESSAGTDGYGLEAYLAEHSAWLAEADEVDREARLPDPTTMSAEDAARYELDYFGTDDERVEIVERDGAPSSVPGGGCLGEASRAVWGDIEQELRLRDARGTAESEIWEAILANGAVVDTLDAWKDCVAEEGYEVEDPGDAVEIALTAAQSGDFERERLVAVADASCKADTGLGSAVQAAFLEAANAALPDLEDDLLALQQFEAAALERAKDILRFGE
jgi:hypothetical protein